MGQFGQRGIERRGAEQGNALGKVGKPVADMFVDEDGLTKRLPRNKKATAIYRNNWLTQHPNTDPESMACIVGPAVVFSARVWY